MLHYCTLKEYKKRMEMSSWLTASSNGELTRFCHNWKIFFYAGSGMADCGWRRKCFITGSVFLFSSARLLFLTQKLVPSSPNNIILGFWSLKGTIETCQHALHC